MMLACVPQRFVAGILDVLIAVEFPDNIAVPIDLYQIDIILNTELRISSSRAAQHIAAG
ncbi:hypothetical protein D3C81_2300700 [compost metagenome]